MNKLVIIGGSGALGRTVINTFKSKSPYWKVMNFDYSDNSQAEVNYKLPSGVISEQELMKISKNDFLQSQVDCVVNVAGGWTDGKFEDFNVLERVNEMMTMNLYSSILAVHFTKRYLKKNSLLVLTGAASVKEDVHSWMIGYQLSKNSVHYISDIMTRNSKELPEGSKLITILPTTIDTMNNRKAMPDADFTTWVKPEVISEKIKSWADGLNRPEDTYYKF
jgi:NAD(P)-dependent dehydrogenase (short-subunit alcohol dehydrogenase family)